jgi:hypothetical protein
MVAAGIETHLLEAYDSRRRSWLMEARIPLTSGFPFFGVPEAEADGSSVDDEHALPEDFAADQGR